MSLTNESKFANWMQVVRDHGGAALIGAVDSETAGDSVAPTTWKDKLVAALQTPFDSAPLADTVYPGDIVAISVGPDVPGTTELIEALTEQLVKQGVRLTDIRILGPSSAFPVPTSAESPSEIDLGNRAQWIEHHADDQKSMSMVGVSRHNHAIYLNRYLVEADVVIPVVLMNRDEALTLSGSIYPMWSSAETQDRLRGNHAEQNEEAKEAESLVCPFMMIGVIPAPGVEEGEVVAGMRNAVQHHAKQRLKSLWTSAPATHAAVLATLEAHYDLGLWDRLRRALQNAMALSAEQAPIILLLAPGVASSGTLRGGPRKRSGEKARLMEIVEEATRHRPIFLASELDPNQIEELGMGAIESLAEFSKLIQRHPDLAVIRDADRWRIHE